MYIPPVFKNNVGEDFIYGHISKANVQWKSFESMIEHLPLYISIGFALITLATLLFFYATLRHSTLERSKLNWVIAGLLIWLVLQAVLSISHVYSTGLQTLPPKIAVFGIAPALLLILILFLTRAGRSFIDGLPLGLLTYLHSIRIPVEIVLYWLFLYKTIPELMTFTGRNFDILAGITAPIIAYIFTKKRINKNILLLWNLVGLGLLFNIVVNALLSAPGPLQQFAFEQPNIAIVYFPFSWLPTFVVPVVMFAHFASIRQLLRANK